MDLKLQALSSNPVPSKPNQLNNTTNKSWPYFLYFGGVSLLHGTLK
jgi:hypothetical protein